MIIITPPASPVMASEAWTLDVPSQVNRSKITGRRRGILFPQAPRYYCTAALPPILGERNVFPWRAFIGALKGVANGFPLIAVENRQIAGIAPTILTGGATGYTCDSTGWGANGLKLRAGQFVTIANQLLMLQADVVSSGGNASLIFERQLWLPTVAGDPITVDWPYAVMTSTDPKLGWAVDIGQDYTIKFSCEEAF